MGAAMLGAVAAGSTNGGYDSIQQAGKAMGGGIKKTYEPQGKHRDIYNRLYAQYVRLHDYFGRNEQSPIKQLKAIKLEVMGGESSN